MERRASSAEGLWNGTGWGGSWAMLGETARRRVVKGEAREWDQMAQICMYSSL